MQPGLGLNEAWYTWIVSISSAGELIGAIAFGNLSRYIYIKWLLLTSLAFNILGGTLYGIGKYGWMLLAGEELLCLLFPMKVDAQLYAS